jgi:hypothetical protein
MRSRSMARSPSCCEFLLLLEFFRDRGKSTVGFLRKDSHVLVSTEKDFRGIYKATVYCHYSFFTTALS